MKKRKIYKENFGRSHVVKTVNIETYQEEILKRKNLNFSALTRMLLDEFFGREFPELLNELREGEK